MKNSILVVFGFKQFKLLGCAAFCMLGVGVIPLASAQSYSFQELAFGAVAINDRGQVLGYQYLDSQVVIWNGSTLTGLSNLPGATSSVSDINNAGQVVGTSYTSDGVGHATIWNGTTPTELGNLPGATFSVATAINDAGQVVGSSGGHAVIWNGTTPTDIGTFGPSDINNAGQVVGSSGHAVIWNGTTLTDLGVMGGHSSYAEAINNRGQVVGVSEMPLTDYRAVIWNDATPTALTNMNGSDISVALAINDLGQVVGWSRPLYRAATLWDGTTVWDLNSLVDSGAAGWTLIAASDINNRGQIIGYAEDLIPGGAHTAFILSPVPEPEIYALMLAGLGVVGWVGRRKKSTERATV